MIRPLGIIVWALLISHPAMPKATAQRYAVVLQEEASEHGWDPFTYISLITFESRWNAGAEGDCHGGKCEAIGLGQIWARFIGACRNEPSSQACRNVRSSLKDGEHNIRVLAGQLARWRSWCKERTGRALLRDSLAGYGGLSHPRVKGAACGKVKRMGKWRRKKFSKTTERNINRVIRHRLMLIRKLKAKRSR